MQRISTPTLSLLVSALVSLVFLLCPTTSQAAIRYVKPTAAGAGNGSSWADASADLQAMLFASAAGDEVWVAAGTYVPTQDPFGSASPSDPRDKTFYVPSGVKFYGGFAGTETALTGRIVAAPTTTTLSGDIGAPGNNADNCYHVVLGAAPNGTTTGITVDGFTITGGNTTGAPMATVLTNGYYPSRQRGAGILAGNGINTLSNNTLIANISSTFGGGIYTNVGTQTIVNNTFINNSADMGGGLMCDFGTSTVINNTFTTNTAAYGGGMSSVNGNHTLRNNTFMGNSASNQGGAIRMSGGTTAVTNCIIWNNTAPTNPGIWGSPAVSYSIVQGGLSGTGNSGNDPLFANSSDADGADNLWRTSDDGLQLRSCSPAIDAGTPTNAPATDILGNARYDMPTVGSTTVDLGAYERQTGQAISAAVMAGSAALCNSGTANLTVSVTGGVSPFSVVYSAGTVNGYTSGANIPVSPTSSTTYTLSSVTDAEGCASPSNTGSAVVTVQYSRVYVDAAVSASGAGTSWGTALKTVHEGIDLACTPGGEVWVKAGTYVPTQDPFGSTSPADPSDKTFYVKDGVKIFGGFAGTETATAQRNIAANPTILSGDIGTTGNTADNCYHVVLAAGYTGVTVDGFTITGGNTNNSPLGLFYNINGIITLRIDGGGIHILYGTNILTNNIIHHNNSLTNGSGAGVCLIGGTTIMTNNTLRDNSGGGGGGLVINGGTHTLTNNRLYNNSAVYNGGGIAISGGTHTLTNNILSNNTANYGGGISLEYLGTNTLLVNNTLYGNNAGSGGGGIYTYYSTNTLRNNLFWANMLGGNPAVAGADYFTDAPSGTNSNTLSQNLLQLASSNYPVNNSLPYGIGTSATGNLFAIDPLFVNPSDPDGPDNLWGTADDGLMLQATSPAINAGTNTGVTATTDLAGNARINGGTVDMGAYEYLPGLSASISGPTAYCAGTPSTLSVSGTAPGRALQLNGTDQYLITPALTSSFSGSSMTIELWFKANAAGVMVSELGQNAINSGWNDSQLEILSTGEVKAGIWAGYLASVSLGTVTFGTWNHAVVRYNSATNTLDGALNGIVSGSVSAARQTPGAQYWAFGAPCAGANHGSGAWFSGQLDEIRIWNTARTNTEIAWNYRNTVSAATSGLVAYYKLDATSGATATDATANGYHGTTANAPTWISYSSSLLGSVLWTGGATSSSTAPTTSGSYTATVTDLYGNTATTTAITVTIQEAAILANGPTTYCASSPTTLTSTLGGNGLQLNGTDQYLITPDLTAAFPTSSMTIELWVKANAAGVIATNLGTNAINTNYHASLLEVLSNGNVRARMWNLTPAVELGTVSFGTWNHITIRYNGTTNTLDGLLNGVPSAATVSGARQIANPGNYLAFGPVEGTNLGAGGYLSGQLDEIRIWNTARTNAEIANNYAKGIAANTTGLIAYYKLDEASGTTAADATANGYTATAANAPTWNVPSTSPLGGTVLWSPGSATTTSITPATSGNYAVTVTTAAGCASTSAPVAITVNGPTAAVLAGTQSICSSGTANLTVAITGGTAPYSVVHSGGTVGSYASGANIPVLPSATTTYTLTSVTDANGCSSPSNAGSAVVTVGGPALVYVDAAVGSSGAGTSWGAAVKTLQEGINLACGSGGEVWVKAGTYHPTTTTDRSISFSMKNGVAIYGGFAGTENLLSQRNWTTHATILSGDIGNPGDNTDNSYHIINNQGSGITSTAVLNGFTIRDGNANGGGSVNNHGGGMYNNSNSSPTVTNCVFSGNTSVSYGGGMFNSASPMVTNCVFSGNSAVNGGGIANAGGGSASPTVSNCAFVGNSANNGGGITIFGFASSSIINCTFFNNTGSSNNGGVYFTSVGICTLKNCVFWGNSSAFGNGGSSFYVTNSIVQGGYAGAGNSSSDPLFVNAADPDGIDNLWGTSDDGLRLSPCSPAINTGTNTGVTATTDIAGATRIYNTTVDMGAYEFAKAIAPTSSANATHTATLECTDGSGWTHYFRETSTDATLLLSVYKNGYSIGTVGDGTFGVQGFTSAGYGSGDAPQIGAPYVQRPDWHVMNRWWDVTPNPQLPGGNSGVKVRSYYTNQDITDLSGATGSSLTTSMLRFYKVNGAYATLNPDPDGNLSTNDGHAGIPAATSCSASGYREYAYSPAATTCDDGSGMGIWNSGTAWGVPYAEYDVQAFSGGGGGGSATGMGALPVEWLSFSASTDGQTARLAWITATETNASHFEIERSTNGTDFSPIGTRPATGNSNAPQTYESIDEQPVMGSNFYRIKAVDLNGQATYSEVRELSFAATSLVRLYPNPTNGLVVIESTLPVETVHVYDPAGREVMTSPSTRLNLSELAPGVYTLMVQGADWYSAHRLIKE